MNAHPPKVLVTKIGLDGHDRGSRVVDAAEAGCTHGEICAMLRRELGFGQPLVMV
jgi:hypothetical protein